VDLSKILAEAQVTFESTLSKKNITLKIEGDSPVAVLAEPSSLSFSVISNLLSNAIKFSKPDSEIVVHVTKKEGRVAVTIKDTGIGMGPDLISKIFMKNVKTTRAGTMNEKGTGFGMPITKRYMELFGGTIRITSKTHENAPAAAGTTIHLDFAAADMSAIQIKAPS
jgi:signal transduction histidine kinase